MQNDTAGETIKPLEKELEVLDVALSEGNTQLALLKAKKQILNKNHVKISIL